MYLVKKEKKKKDKNSPRGFHMAVYLDCDLMFEYFLELVAIDHK